MSNSRVIDWLGFCTFVIWIAKPLPFLTFSLAAGVAASPRLPPSPNYLGIWTQSLNGRVGPQETTPLIVSSLLFRMAPQPTITKFSFLRKTCGWTSLHARYSQHQILTNSVFWIGKTLFFYWLVYLGTDFLEFTGQHQICH